MAEGALLKLPSFHQSDKALGGTQKMLPAPALPNASSVQLSSPMQPPSLMPRNLPRRSGYNLE